MKRFHYLLLLLLLAPVTAPALAEENIHQRGELNNARHVFETKQQGHVAFMGGSITEMNGYRPMVSGDLEKRFPQCKFKFTDAGIASTCSTTGAFRLERDVLSHGPVDLFFVEFAVNDDQDATHPRERCIRGLEGIIRHVRTHNPRAEIVVVYFVNPHMLEQLQKGKTPLPIAAHEAVAEHYGVTSIHLAQELADQIAAGSFTWQKFGGTHPAAAGNRLCADLIDQLFTTAWAKPLAGEFKPANYSLPAPLDEFHYGRGRFVSPETAAADDAWKWGVPSWKQLPGNCRDRFLQENLLSADKPGAELVLKFSGRAVGAYVLAGPDAGLVEASIDDRAYAPIDLYHRFSGGLHYPRSVMFADELEPGEHTLKLRISSDKNGASKGHAVRILQFNVN